MNGKTFIDRCARFINESTIDGVLNEVEGTNNDVEGTNVGRMPLLDEYIYDHLFPEDASKAESMMNRVQERVVKILEERHYDENAMDDWDGSALEVVINIYARLDSSDSIIDSEDTLNLDKYNATLAEYGLAGEGGEYDEDELCGAEWDDYRESWYFTETVFVYFHVVDEEKFKAAFLDGDM